MGREKVHQSHADLKRSIYGNLAAPGAPERIGMTVSGNPNVRREAKIGNYNEGPSRHKGGAVKAGGYHNAHHSYKLKGHR